VKIRVLEVLPSLARAGAENMAVSLACGMDRDRFQMEVVSLYDPRPNGLEPVLADHGVTVRHLGKRRGFDPMMWPRLARVFGELHPDVVHTHSYLLRYVLPVRRGAIVHTVHNVARNESDALGRVINRLAFRRGVLPVAVGTEVARSFRATYGFEAAATIPNGIDAERYFLPAARSGWRQAHGFTDDDLLIVSVARLEPQKDTLGLIRAFAQGLKDEAGCHLLIAGWGSLEDAAREVAAVSGIADRIHFLGVRADVPELLSAADLFALASRWEGGPLAVMEAMAAHLPVVATTVGAVPELVEPGVTGILTEPGDAAALARALASLARDPERRRAMGEAAGARAARFTATAMIAAYAELFERAARTRK
jgi:glycosyltransferase involved in cell wall biosynthesis